MNALSQLMLQRMTKQTATLQSTNTKFTSLSGDHQSESIHMWVKKTGRRNRK